MTQNEYYVSSENWPQPEDDAITLDTEGYMGKSLVRKKASSKKKQRRKFSESMAGVTAATVAVVMISNSVPALQGISAGLKELMPSEICVICGDLECPYWDTMGMESLRIYSEADPVWQDCGMYEMKAVPLQWDQCGAIFTQNGERLILRVDQPSIMMGRGGSVSSGYRSERDCVEPVTEATYCNWLYYDLYDKTDQREGYVFVQLVYAPDGVMPDRKFGIEEWDYERFGMQDSYYYAIPVDGVEHAELRIHTNMGQSYCEEVVKYCQVNIVDGAVLSYDVGDTMTFTEREYIRRSWNDNSSEDYRTRFNFQLDSGDESKSIMFDVWHKDYAITGYYNPTNIALIADNWNNIFAQWKSLNDNAASKGHQICFDIRHNGEITVNSVTYDLYLLYTTAPVDGYNHYPWLSHFFVPQQEPQIAIHFEESIEPEELAELLALPAEENLNEIRREMLECFDLR